MDFEKKFKFGLKTEQNFPGKNEVWIAVSVERQKLFVFEGSEVLKEFPVSTAKNGIGFVDGSFKTPLGFHRICEKIGDGLPVGAVLKSREFTEEVAEIENREVSTGKDLITTRILRLEGLEEGKNRGYDEDGNLVDTFERYIYIHGTNEEGLIGKPVSHGCIRMKNKDIIELFDLVDVGTIVYIAE